MRLDLRMTWIGTHQHDGKWSGIAASRFFFLLLPSFQGMKLRAERERAAGKDFLTFCCLSSLSQKREASPSLTATEQHNKSGRFHINHA